jgi:hypothetical protein
MGEERESEREGKQKIIKRWERERERESERGGELN